MTASSAPTSTVSSSSTLISCSVPATGEGISVSTLSVETSSSGSSTATSSPTCLSQRVTVPSVTDSPSAGSVTDVPPPPPPPDCRSHRSPAARRQAPARRVPHRRSPAPRPAPRPAPARRPGRHRRCPARPESCAVLAARLVGGARVAGRLAFVADHRQDGTDLDRVVLVGLDLQQRAGDGGGDLGVDLVGGDLQQRLVDRDGVADLLQPTGDGAFGDGLPECREGDFGGQWTSFALGRICVVVGDQVWACSGLPASARWASPRASCWVGWAWTRGATSSGWASQP